MVHMSQQSPTFYHIGDWMCQRFSTIDFCFFRFRYSARWFLACSFDVILQSFNICFWLHSGLRQSGRNSSPLLRFPFRFSFPFLSPVSSDFGDSFSASLDSILGCFPLPPFSSPSGADVLVD